MAFKQIKGHLSQIKMLQDSVETGTLPHALFFYGLEGVGKETLARQLAKMLNCEKKELDSCDACAVCHRIDENSFSDFYFISPSGISKTIKIEDVQLLQKKLNLSRYEGRAKVILISEAETLNESSGNALLKMLEEPQEKTFFLLVSSNHEAILSTIRSRCRQIPFYPLSNNEVEKILSEKGVDNPEERDLLVSFSEGSAGRALRFFEEKGKNLRQSVIKFVLTKNLVPTEALFISEQLQKVIEEDKVYLWDILKILEGAYRDLLLLQFSANKSQLLNPDWEQGLKQLSLFYRLDEIESKIKIIERIRMNLHMNAQLKWALDYLFLSLSAPKEEGVSRG